MSVTAIAGPAAAAGDFRSCRSIRGNCTVAVVSATEPVATFDGQAAQARVVTAWAATWSRAPGAAGVGTSRVWAVMRFPRSGRGGAAQRPLVAAVAVGVGGGGVAAGAQSGRRGGGLGLLHAGDGVPRAGVGGGCPHTLWARSPLRGARSPGWPGTVWDAGGTPRVGAADLDGDQFRFPGRDGFGAGGVRTTQQRMRNQRHRGGVVLGGEGARGLSQFCPIFETASNGPLTRRFAGLSQICAGLSQI